MRQRQREKERERERERETDSVLQYLTFEDWLSTSILNSRSIAEWRSGSVLGP